MSIVNKALKDGWYYCFLRAYISISMFSATGTILNIVRIWGLKPGPPVLKASTLPLGYRVP